MCWVYTQLAISDRVIRRSVQLPFKYQFGFQGLSVQIPLMLEVGFESSCEKDGLMFFRRQT